MNIKRRITGSALVLCMLIFLTVLLSGCDSRSEIYESALKLMEAGECSQAAVEFEKLGDYKNSRELFEKAQEQIAENKRAEAYAAAQKLKKEGKYEAAIEAFKALNGYRDSINQISLCEAAILDPQYENAISLKEEGKYEEAIEAFKALKDYKDSEEQIKSCEELRGLKYKDAKVLMINKQYTKAIEAFKELNGFKDSASLIEKCESELKNVWGEAVFDIYHAPVGSYVRYGTYEQDGDSSNGTEEIEWMVLGKDDEKVLLISRYGLEASGYTDEWKEDSWNDCNIRSWLNADFKNSAFTKEEKSRILGVEVNKEEGFQNGEEPDENALDKVFLLSMTELEKYFESDADRICEPTPYAKLQAKSSLEEDISKIYDEDLKSCIWWLRSAGSEGEPKTTYVFKNGRMVEDESIKPDRCFFVRPVLYINLDPNELPEEEEPVCEHQWTGATCTQASYCVLCGETNGEALGHYWIDDAWEDQYKAYLANTDPSQWKDQGAGYNYHWFCSRCHCLYLDGYYVGCEYSPFGTYEVTGNWLNVRSYPSTNLDNIVYKLNKGERIQVIGAINGWAAFWYSRENMSQIGWVSMDYLAYYSSEYRITNVW